MKPYWKDNWTHVPARKDELEIIKKYQKKHKLSSPIKAAVHAINEIEQCSQETKKKESKKEIIISA